ncbi:MULTISPECIES: substrate-binding periplasmic protein [Deefgea]|uniref:Transporter substrate-binding domain-containing protein n=1 Tax=Deefgea chitinilytica TaxID=570276 RepID=A0ABS2CDN6_9NEIS|nr:MULTISPECIES: transporter substrate-binding domain-containing protein [Deefgea]MBM5571476.1 transporter substrate-binding domain-containing protein [Deefgea chitinilytica]MBM9888709.1 transporter substrate-binding domain-containing protein [Deefgea sp. CFH1-16]
MRYFRLCLSGLLCGWLSSAQAADLTLYLGDNPPFNSFVAHRPEGMAVEVMTEVLKRSQLSAENKDFPWARALTTVQMMPNHCAYTVGRIPEREAKFHWLGPIATVQGTLFGLRERQLQIRSLEDARKYRIGDLRQGANAIFLESKGFVIDYANTEDQNLRKLLVGHIDLYPGTPYSAREIVQRLKIDPQRVQALYVFNQIDLYLACNLQTPSATLAKLTSAFESMRADKTLQKISAQYEARFALTN